MVPKLIKKLRAAIESGDDQTIFTAAVEAGEVKSSTTVSLLLTLLKDDDRIVVKNGAAIGLRKLRVDRALPVLMLLLRDRRYRRTRGTFVYALQTLNWWKVYPVEVAVLLSDENYEVRQMALEAVRKAKSRLTTQARLDILAGLHLPLIVERKIDDQIAETMRDALQSLVSTDVAKVQQLVHAG